MWPRAHRSALGPTCGLTDVQLRQNAQLWVVSALLAKGGGAGSDGLKGRRWRQGKAKQGNARQCKVRQGGLPPKVRRLRAQINDGADDEDDGGKDDDDDGDDAGDDADGQDELDELDECDDLDEQDDLHYHRR